MHSIETLDRLDGVMKFAGVLRAKGLTSVSFPFVKILMYCPTSNAYTNS